MCGERRDDVVVAIAIDVVGIHLGTATTCEHVGSEFPQRISLDRFRLSEPAVLRDDVLLTIAVDVADSQSVAESCGGDFFGNGVERPFAERFLPVDGDVAEFAVAGADEFGFFVPDDVEELR